MLVTLEEAKAHCRAEDQPDAQIAAYIPAAEDAVQGHLNRRVFATQSDLDAALDDLPDELAAAQTAYQAAKAAADAEPDATKRAAMLSVAEARLAAATLKAQRTLNGIVLTPSIKAAILLAINHLFAHRASVVIGASVAELPLGVKDLLRRDRRVMMP